MSSLNAEEIYWIERLAAATFESGIDFPSDIFETKITEEAQEKLQEWYLTPGRWVEIVLNQMWAEDGVSLN